MSIDLRPVDAVDKVFQGFRNGFCAKPVALDAVRKILSQASADGVENVRRALTSRFRTSEMAGAQAGPNIVNQAALALTCLGEIVAIPGLLELAFSRVSNDLQLNKVWADEIAPEIHWVMVRHPEKLDAISDQHLRALTTHITASKYVFGEDVARAMQNLVKTADWIAFEKFQKSLNLEDFAEVIDGEPANAYPIRVFSPLVADALNRAADYLKGQGQFDPKIGADLIRTSIDETHREVVKRLTGERGGPSPDLGKDGARRTFMREAGFISLPEEKFISAIYSLISEEASHKLLTERETTLFMHVTVSHYIRLLVERLNRRANP